jgi:hypothetical protein
VTPGSGALPALPAPFRRSGEHIACSLPGGEVLFTTRRGGVSRPPYDTLNLGRFTDDDPAAVRANRARLAALTGVATDRTAQGRQVHGARVERVRVLPAAERPPADADGQAIALDGAAAVVLTADCLPVALVAPEALAMVHAGWRGLAAGVIAEGVAALRDLGARGPIRAAIGPSAGGCCYAVGEDVHAVFAADDARDGDRLDLVHVARRRLAEAGVEEVYATGLCTLCTPPELFFSHRRDGPATGRQAGIAWRS